MLWTQPRQHAERRERHSWASRSSGYAGQPLCARSCSHEIPRINTPLHFDRWDAVGARRQRSRRCCTSPWATGPISSWPATRQSRETASVDRRSSAIQNVDQMVSRRRPETPTGR
jgi:hypothetical protein